MDHRSATAVEEYRRQRAALLQAFPELADDMQTLFDTLEGEAEAPDLIAEFIRAAREDEAMASAVTTMLRELAERKSRLEARSEKRRAAALAIMQAIELRKLELPDFTASVRTSPPRVEVFDETSLPDEFFRVIRHADKTAIKEALATRPVAGARMTNGGETISIRTK